MTVSVLPEPSAAVEPCLTLDELCEVIRYTPRHARDMLKAGQLPPPIKIGKRLLWRPADVRRWLESLPTQEGPVHDQ
jgi:predicted DNA-binding transcriptional regulator AlpA